MSSPSPTTTAPAPAIADLDPAKIRRRLEDVRRRTLDLVLPLDWPTLRRQQIPILSPMAWDLGHIGSFEELWLVQRLGGRPPLADGYEEMFDPVRNPRPTREKLPLPDLAELTGYWQRVREAALEVFGRGEGEAALRAGGLVYEMVAEHEEQHQETLLQAMQVLESPPYRPPVRRTPPPARPVDDEEMVWVAGGPCELGFAGPGFAYDNERQRHEATVGDFSIDRFPVSNRRYLAFVEDDGYRRRELWSEAGWAFCEEERLAAPRTWKSEDGVWTVRHFDRREPLVPEEPVVHLCWHEAEAFCRWAGRRLPSEAEWEKAALWDQEAGRARRYPWGEEPPTPGVANVDQLAFGPAPLGTYPAGASPYGLEQVIGDVWEWTASSLAAYPGFVAFPYVEYSEIFFGTDYKVLRGGSWATRPAVARGTYRNWDYPIRRQIFAGFRCVLDAS